MAYEKPGEVHTLSAAADLSSKQHYFVKLDSSGNAAACTAATDVPIGELKNKPDAAGKAAEIMMTGISKVSSDAALTIGNLVGPSSDGQGDAKSVGSDTTEYVVGQVLVASAAAGGLAVVAINCLSPHRAA